MNRKMMLRRMTTPSRYDPPHLPIERRPAPRFNPAVPNLDFRPGQARRGRTGALSRSGGPGAPTGQETRPGRPWCAPVAGRAVVTWEEPGEPIMLTVYGPDGEVAVPLLPKRALTLAQELLTSGVAAIKADPEAPWAPG